MLSHRLKELRLNRQLSQVAIAEKLGISNGLYNKYEKKGVNPPYDTLQKLSKIYGVSIDYILGNDTVPNGSKASPTQIEFSLNLKELRKISGYTQSKLAQTLNTTQANLSGWETGKWEPDSKMLAKMADIFGVSVDYLLGRDTPPPMPARSDNTITEARLKALGIDTSQFADLSDEQLAVVRDTLTALLDSLKKSNK